jgi:DNA gyrase/topoisomerase IV subunit B
MSIESKYQKKTQLEHILTRPDTYVGDIKLQTEKLYIHQDGRIVKQEIQYVPALYKIFDEIIVNASDHTKNDKTCKNIKITVQEDMISVCNDGIGIDVEIHQEYKIYVPELVFGELLTSTNYDDTEKRVTGGRNGYGAKLTNIFSTFFSVETIDTKRKRKFYQEFTNNMSNRTKPIITELKTIPSSYTKIVFKPDFEKFGITELTPDMIGLFEKRVYDLAGTLEGINVYLNDILIPIKSFQDYIKLYFDTETELEVISEKQPRWDISFVYRPDGGFEHISHVNNICTYHGGSHVDYINDQIIDYLQEQIVKKNKDAVNKIKSHSIKDHYMVFINCTIENPAFTSQTKETLKTKQNEFGSTCKLSDKVLKKINSSGILNVLLEFLKFKEETLLMKKTDGKKVNAIKGIPKLEDAEWAGTKKSKMCKLILTEGDSAKALAMSGRAVVGNQKYGIFPLKGKLLNVRGATPKELLNNEEIINLKKILGLKHGKIYVNSGKEAKETKEDDKTEKEDSKSKICDVSELRYGGIVSLCDQDVDGYHIKGLLINFFEYFWPSLLKIDGFITCLSTPIVKATKGKEAKIFYNLTDYTQWKETPASNNYHIKYYKGLGTSTREEGKEYFTDLEDKLIHYLWRPILGSTNQVEDQDSDEPLIGEIDHPCHQAIMLAFDKKRADDRKAWLKNYDKNDILTPDIKQVPYNDFVNKELIHFSNEDIKRSIPSMVDGLKPSQRKIMYGTILRKLFTKNSEIKVAQLTGFISDKTCYHHGEQSLNMAIINMAQRFVGSNNINILMPSGQFGCLSPETPVLTWNGDIKKAIDIKEGDELVGDDGEKRTVLQTTNGVDEMYEIKDIHNNTMKVNSQHILTLYLTNNFEIKWKESNGTWYFIYFDGKEIKQQSLRTNELDKKEIHYNKSKLTKEQGYEKILKIHTELKEKYNTSPIIDIKLEDYLKLSTFAKRGMFMISNFNCINWTKKNVPIDPYIFGAWLGDGDQHGRGFTSCDEEIIKRFVIWANTIDAEISHHHNSNHDGYHYTIKRKGSGTLPAVGSINHSCATCIGCQTSNIKLKHNTCDWHYTPDIKNNDISNVDKHLNPFVQLLKKNNLLMNKHIPVEYMINDKETRLQLLAGFIDTDGTIKSNDTQTTFIEIAQSYRLHKNLIESLDFIAKSLGYATSIYYSNDNKITKKGESRQMMTLRIMGENINEIPTLVKRKQIKFSEERESKTIHYTKFNVTSLGQGEFYGWMIDKNERFLLGNFIVTHNSRLMGGKDHASPRYIFTHLNPIVRLLFREEDDPILNYLDDDGIPVEPEYYIPILPMILINGAEGIGTGFSTQVLPYNPLDLIDNIKSMMENKPLKDLKPYFHGFKGKISQDDKTYTVQGIHEITGSDLIVTELPVGVWTSPYKEYLNELEEKKEINKFVNNNTDEDVHFKITIDGKKLDDWTDKELLQKFKLVKKISVTNMHLYDKDDKIKKYANVNDILREFYQIRLDAYTIRKNYYLEKYRQELDVLKWKMKFIEDVLEDRIVINRKKRDEIVSQLIKKKYPNMGDEKYDYLLTMPIHNFTHEKIEELQEKINNKESEMKILDSKPEKQIWSEELEEFKLAYVKEYNPLATKVSTKQVKPDVSPSKTKKVIDKKK